MTGFGKSFLAAVLLVIIVYCCMSYIDGSRRLDQCRCAVCETPAPTEPEAPESEFGY